MQQLTVPKEVGQLTGVQSPNVKPAEYEPFFITQKSAQMDKLSKVYDDKTLKQLGVVECATCASRQYQDGSNDPGVSFKTPTHISPENSAQAVMSHEQEHVVRNQSKAAAEDRQVISQSVTIHSAICPECGKSYTSGGTTKTVTAGKNPNTPYQKSSPQTGLLMDLKL